MTIDPTSASNPTTPMTAAGQKADVLGKDAFMKLLVTKMQNQDPTKPEDDAAMLSQLAQFSALEQMQQMNATLTSIAGFFTDVATAASSSSSTTPPKTTAP